MTTISNCTFAGSIHNEAFVAGLIHLQGTPISIDRERKRFFLKKADSAPMDANVESPSMHKYNNVVVVSGYKRLRTELPVTSPFALPLTQKEKKRRKARQARFGPLKESLDPLYRPLAVDAMPNNNGEKVGNSKFNFVGESTNHEKEYLRLTSFPRKEDVRPLDVLVKSLAHIKRRYIQDEDFCWANDQLKSVRQDITVQRLRNAFVLEVYETHARILLENGDLDEFNQCQTVIRSLVKGGLDTDETSLCGDISSDIIGDDSAYAPLKQSKESADEFRGYAILYALVRKSWVELKQELVRVEELKSESTGDSESSAIHAVLVVKAVEENDFRAFFRLYDCAPHLSAYLMDFLVKRVRDNAYERIVAAYRPTISIEHIRDALQLKDLEETRRFLRQHEAVFVKEKEGPLFWIDCKASYRH